MDPLKKFEVDLRERIINLASIYDEPHMNELVEASMSLRSLKELIEILVQLIPPELQGITAEQVSFFLTNTSQALFNLSRVPLPRKGDLIQDVLKLVDSREEFSPRVLDSY